jgi:hypothetical protein
MQVVSYGGGTNSTAMLVGMVEKGEPVSLITFADTGGEMPHTYEYIELFSAWLGGNGYPAITIARRCDLNGDVLTLEQNCLSTNTLPSIAFGFKTCSQKFKIQPQEKFFNNYGPAKEWWKAGNTITRCVGYDAGEPQRAKPYSDDKYTNRYPLIEWGWGRDECVDAIRRAGLPQPGKSSCFFCPSMKKHEIIQLNKRYPELAQRAIEMEQNATLTSITGLGRGFSWEKLIKADEAQLDLFPESPFEIDCACYDGEGE